MMINAETTTYAGFQEDRPGSSRLWFSACSFFPFFVRFPVGEFLVFPALFGANPSSTPSTNPGSSSDAPGERKRPIIETARAESHAPLKAMAKRNRSRREMRRPIIPNKSDTAANQAAAL